MIFCEFEEEQKQRCVAQMSKETLCDTIESVEESWCENKERRQKLTQEMISIDSLHRVSKTSERSLCDKAENVKESLQE